MPKNARCFLTEDSDLLRETTRAYLVEGAHTVVAEAANVQAALTMVPHLHDMGVTVAVLDGNLNDAEDSSGNDGRRIAAAIRALNVGIHIVCVSMKKYAWADRNVTKYEMADAWRDGERNVLADTIDALE